MMPFHGKLAAEIIFSVIMPEKVIKFRRHIAMMMPQTPFRKPRRSASRLSAANNPAWPCGFDTRGCICRFGFYMREARARADLAKIRTQ